jgi:glycine/D-amino acid oxidase-like deaminating enzyme/nitrite reductase/ring-hydroxylating ferredoxin subunit
MTQPSAEGQRQSLWDLTAAVPLMSPLLTPHTTDVCVVGAGIAGLSVAYELTRLGHAVTVLDDGPIGGGETSRTTAHVSTAFDDFYHEAERLHGAEATARLADSYRRGVERIVEIVHDEAIDCDFERVDGWWFASDQDGVSLLEAEAAAAQRAGFSDVVLANRWPVPHLRAPAYLHFPNQAQFHPLHYLAGLVRAIQQRGGVLHSQAHVVNVSDAGDDGLCTVETDRGVTVRARDVVMATNSPVNDRFAMHTKQHAYRTYVVAFRIARNAFPPVLLWDTLDPYHYVRLLHAAAERDTTTHDVLIVGGEDHKTGQESDENAHFDRLEQWARGRFAVEDVVARWSGQVLEPVDHVAFIGRNPGDQHVFIATGDSGNGITHGAIAGLLLTDLIMGRENAWQAIYDPGRLSLKALPTWIAENANVARQYVDLITPGEVPGMADVPAGSGRVVRQGVHKLAVYRDADGTLLVRSAVCPHLGCIVDWNAAENTWDCPCHGSRFAVDGEVLNGPAVSPLPEVTVAQPDWPRR